MSTYIYLLGRLLMLLTKSKSIGTSGI